jgi:DNA helicase II / ATP-dependent DNA helicase PcrA
MISAIEIAKRIQAVDPSFIAPSDEQIPIIEAALAPAVVIAGAGSGKTETMSQRVLYLVANQLIKPDQLLGLTFTRKSAGDLAKRIRKRLRQLKAAGLLPDLLDESDLTVSTYHSYAGRVLADHAIRIGVDAAADPIGEAAAWQVAFEEVSRFAGGDLQINGSPKSVVEEVMDLSTQLAENNKSASDVSEYTYKLLDQLAQLTEKTTNPVNEFKAELEQRLAILPIVAAFDDRRREQGLLTFNDHMSMAAQLVTQSKTQHNDDIGLLERAKYKVVLLDEYQDTSFNQINFLSGLFGNNHPVTAVGDPNQAIYGWRSASSETLDTFAKSFNSDATRYTLLTTFRNDQSILEIANVMIDQIAQDTANLTPISGAPTSTTVNSKNVEKLKAGKSSQIGEVICGIYETQSQETQAIAEYFAKYWFDPDRLQKPENERSTFAVLVRARTQIDAIQSALRDKNIPTDVLGVGGLVHIPEVADIIALLRTLTMPDSGTALMRLLTGPHLALGARDLMALGAFTRKYANENDNSRGKQLSDALTTDQMQVATADEFAAGSIIESLELLITLTPKELKHYTATPELSEVALTRLRQFAIDIRQLRRSLSGSITDALLAAEQFLSLDTEVLLRSGWKDGRKDLDRFLDEGQKFQKNGGTLTGFLQWLKIAEDAEGGLKPAEVDVRSDAVQILTVHAAKGAEWDFVAVPGLAERNFPNTGRKSDSWIKNAGSIPVSLRGDFSQLPSINFANLSTNKNLKDALERFNDDWKARKSIEEMRLAYVAFTRAKHGLLLSTSHFRNGENAVAPSRLYLICAQHLPEISGATVLTDTAIPDGKNPLIENPITGNWPDANSRYEQKAAQVKEQAKLLATATAFNQSEIDGDKAIEFVDQSILSDLQAILSELKNKSNVSNVFLPSRLSVSTLLYLKLDPNELALRLRRPMPNHIDKYARRGTEFHLWLEEYFKNEPVQSMDEIFYSGDDGSSTEIDAPIQELKIAWQASDWANRKPIGVEVGFETVIAGVVVRGRIDAVYEVSPGKYEVVDWKTGKVKSGEDLSVAALQLAMYRLAFAKLNNLELSNISAAFHYVAQNETIRPADLMNEAELIEIISAVPQLSSNSN